MTPLTDDEIGKLSEITGLDESARRLAMTELFNGTAIGALRRACYEQLLDHWRKDAIPTNATFVFYELEQQGVVKKQRGVNPKTGENYKRTDRQNISDAMMGLREAGLIPWDWLTDETRNTIIPSYEATILDFAIRYAEYGTIDAWEGDPPPLLICEARGVKAALASIAYEYGTPIAATAGQSGGYIVNEIAPLLRGEENEERIVLYIGDHELRGPAEQIEDNTRAYIEQHADRTFVNGQWTKIALTSAQVDEDSDAGRRLRGLALTKPDRRYKPAKEYEAVECEALGQSEIVAIVRARLDEERQLRGLDAIEDVRLRERDEQRETVARLRRLRRR
jgi:hypothetical protein